MIGVVVLAEKALAAGLVAAAVRTLGSHPPGLETVAVDYTSAPEDILGHIRQALHRADYGRGVLFLADIYGATHTNLACQLLERGRIELVSGANLPMLFKVLNYRHLGMDDLIDKALSGGSGGIVIGVNNAALRGKGP
jgi:PTS system ascorbate-specific IIA component